MPKKTDSSRQKESVKDIPTASEESAKPPQQEDSPRGWSIKVTAGTCAASKLPQQERLQRGDSLSQQPEQQELSGGKKSTRREKLKKSRTDLLANDVSVYLSPPYRHEWSEETVTDPDGTVVQVKVHKRGGPHPGFPATEGLRQLIQMIPYTQLRDWVRRKATPPVRDKLNKLYQEQKEQALAGLQSGDANFLFLAVNRFGPRVLMDPEINAVVERWWLDMLDNNVEPATQTEAKSNIGGLCKALTEVGKGRKKKIGPKEKEEIAAACERWLPVCQGLNDDFKRLWEESEYWTSELFQKEARGTLAEKYSIPVEDVKATEQLPKKKSRWGDKTPPREAMLQLVAHKYKRHMKTVETIHDSR